MKPKDRAIKPFLSGDPFTYLTIGKTKANYWHIAVIFGLLVNLPLVLLAAKSNALFNRTNFVGLFQDIGWWINQVFTVPATIAFFFWMPEGINKIIDGLVNNGVLQCPKDNKESLDRFVSRFDRIYSHWAWFVISLIMITAYTIFIVTPVFNEFNTWSTSGNVLFWYTTIFWNLIFTLMALIVVRGVITINWLNKLFKDFEVNIKILHPDKAGGLSPLGSFSIVIGYLIGVYGVTAVMNMFLQSYLITGQFKGLEFNTPVIVQLTVYLILAPYAFFAPLGAAHSAMRDAKNTTLLKISDQFQKDFSKLETVIRSSTKDLEDYSKKIELLQKFHNTVERFPVWPFNTVNLIRFFSSVVSPIALAFLPSLVQMLLK